MTARALSQLCILVVEDDPEHAPRMRQALLRVEPTVRVTTAGHLHKALEALHDPAIACIVTDLRLPDAQGVRALRDLRSARRELPRKPGRAGARRPERLIYSCLGFVIKPGAMQAALDGLIDLLDLEDIEVNIFRGRSPQEMRQRVFGGQVAGQALVAAGRTVERGTVHSLHAYFLRPGDPTTPILYEVDRIRDGRTFTTRRVVAIQHGKAIFNLAASFQPEEPGPEHQIPMPEAPGPETLASWEERVTPYLEGVPEEVRRWLTRDRPIDVRPVDFHDPFHPTPRAPRQLVWIRANGRLPDPLLLHQCVVAYASDLTLLDTATYPHAIQWNDARYVMASLDHAMWFHRSFRADEWLLYVQESPVGHGARGFTTGRLYTQAGVLVISVAQEGLIRPKAPR